LTFRYAILIVKDQFLALEKLLDSHPFDVFELSCPCLAETERSRTRREESICKFSVFYLESLDLLDVFILVK
jgi:hypothetical protein